MSWSIVTGSIRTRATAFVGAPLWAVTTGSWPFVTIAARAVMAWLVGVRDIVMRGADTGSGIITASLHRPVAASILAAGTVRTRTVMARPSLALAMRAGAARIDVITSLLRHG